MSSLTPLREADFRCGAKAATLSRLARAGLPVPDGVVVRDATTDGWPGALPEALARLGGTRFAVRSSGAGEDSALASFAGQYLSVLNVPAEEVAGAVHEVAASGAGAAAYAAATGHLHPGPLSVLVQPMVAAAVAGVAFTRHPVTGVQRTVIEAVHGLGDRLVTGLTTPQRWETDARGTIIAPRTPDVLTTAQARAVADLARQIEELLGGGQDVEWAIDSADVLWALQARPVTTDVSGARGPASTVAGRRLASGTPASPGLARGRVRALSGLDDFARFEAGDVLVCRATSPAWTPVLARAAAVVTEIGGILAHAAIVARELRIPAVTDVPGATDLPEGAVVEVDGSRGQITLVGGS